MLSPVYNERIGKKGVIRKYWAVKHNPRNAVLGRPVTKTFNFSGKKSPYPTQKKAYDAALTFSKRANCFYEDHRYQFTPDLCEVFSVDE